MTSLTLPMLGKFLKSDALLRLSSGEERAAPTVQKTVRVLRQFLAWLVQEGYLTELRLPKSVSMGRTAI